MVYVPGAYIQAAQFAESLGPRGRVTGPWTLKAHLSLVHWLAICFKKVMVQQGYMSISNLSILPRSKCVSGRLILHGILLALALVVLITTARAQAQQYVIATYAGTPTRTPAPAASVPIGTPTGIAADGAGNVYFTNSTGSAFKVAPNGTLTRIAGNGRSGYSGDGGLATQAQLFSARGLAIDGVGNLFINDQGRVRRVSPDGIITTVAGNGTLNSFGDGGPAVDAGIVPIDITTDRAGNLYVTDLQRIRKISLSGLITTVAGNDGHGFSGDGGPATAARLFNPHGITLDSFGNLFIADTGNARIRKISANGTISTIAGNGTAGVSGDGGPASAALLWWPAAVAVDSAGNLLVADAYAARIRKVSTAGIITTIAGTGVAGFAGDGGPALNAQLIFPSGIAVDGLGNIFIVDSNSLDPNNQRIRKISSLGIITTIASGISGDSLGDGGQATSAYLNSPQGLAMNSAGDLFIAEAGGNRVRKVSPSGIIRTVAGNGIPGFAGDNGLATNAELNHPQAVAVDSMSNLFIADAWNARTRKVSPDGIITTVAGNGVWSYMGDGGRATSASIGVPSSLAADTSGNLFIAAGSQVRKVSPEGIISTVAGTSRFGFFSGDGGPAVNAYLGSLLGVATDDKGNLFIADTLNNRIRQVSTDGVINTVAGNGQEAFSGDGGPAVSASLGFPYAVAADSAGNLFIVDGDNCRIRKVSVDGIITTIAGKGCFGYSGDGGPAFTASLNAPKNLTVDLAGNVYVTDQYSGAYVTDQYNGAVRVLRPVNESLLIGGLADAASQRPDPVAPGKIVVIYGVGLGPSQLIQNQANNGQLGTIAGGTSVYFNGIAAPVLYASATQVAAIVPYAITGSEAQVTVSYQGRLSSAFLVRVAPANPNIFTRNQTGSGQAAAINSADGTFNSAANPVAIGDFISLYATGEGQTVPATQDGAVAVSTSTRPRLPVRLTIGGIEAAVQYAGNAPGQVTGLLQINVQIPDGVTPGGYVPVAVQVGDAVSGPGVWIAVSGK